MLWRTLPQPPAKLSLCDALWAVRRWVYGLKHREKSVFLIGNSVIPWSKKSSFLVLWRTVPIWILEYDLTIFWMPVQFTGASMKKWYWQILWKSCHRSCCKTLSIHVCLTGLMSFLVPLSLGFIDNMCRLFRIVFRAGIFDFESMNSIGSQNYLVRGPKLHVWFDYLIGQICMALRFNGVHGLFIYWV